MASSGFAAVLDVLAPPRCAGCGRGGSWYCADCRDGSDPIVRRLGALTLVAAGAPPGPPPPGGPPPTSTAAAGARTPGGAPAPSPTSAQRMSSGYRFSLPG